MKKLFILPFFIINSSFCAQADVELNSVFSSLDNAIETVQQQSPGTSASELEKPLIENKDKGCFSRLRKKIRKKCFISTIVTFGLGAVITIGVMMNLPCRDSFVLNPGECSQLNFAKCVSCSWVSMGSEVPCINETITPKEIYSMVGPTSGPRCYDMCLTKEEWRLCRKPITKKDLQKQLSTIAHC